MSYKNCEEGFWVAVVVFPEIQDQNEDLCKTKDTSTMFSISSNIDEM